MTNYNDVTGYYDPTEQKIYIVIPYDNVQFGVCSEFDLALSFKDFNVVGLSRWLLKLLQDLQLLFILESTDTIQGIQTMSNTIKNDQTIDKSYYSYVFQRVKKYNTFKNFILTTFSPRYNQFKLTTDLSSFNNNQI